jgi:membrane fusion protein (multidrug efflux system)
MQVGVLTVTASSVTLTQDLPGRVSAFFVAAVEARVSGIVNRRYFREGSDVKAGDVLFQIDPLPYEAALKVAQGNLASATAASSAPERSTVRTTTTRWRLSRPTKETWSPTRGTSRLPRSTSATPG